VEVKPLILSELNPPLNTILVKDQSDLRLVKDFVTETKEFGLDTETNVVQDFTDRKVRLIQVGNKKQQFVIDLLHFAGSPESLSQQGYFKAPAWFAPVADALKPGLESGDHLKIGVNLQFEYEVLKWGFGLRPWNFYDCMLVEQLIYCGRVHLMTKDFWGMDDMLLRYFGLKINKELQTSFDLDNELTEEQIAYAALDTRFPLALRSAQSATLVASKLETVANLVENPAIPAFGDVHLNGFYLDSKDWIENVEASQKKHIVNLEVLDTYFIPVVGGKDAPDIDLAAIEKLWKDEKDKVKRAEYRKQHQAARRTLKEWSDNCKKWEGKAAINYGSPSQLLAALRKMGFGEKKLPSTGDTDLKVLAKQYPVMKALQDYRETAQINKSFGLDYPEKYINKNTGRLHSKINQLGADTGRTSSTKPNVQQIPKGIWRCAFKPRPGYVLIKVDMSGAELRIMAELSGEPSWLEAFRNGWDVHSMGAEMMYRDRWTEATAEGCAYAARHEKCECPGHQDLRDKCKAVNFKVAYGGMDLSTNLGITKRESDEILAKHREAFPVLHAYLKKSGEDAKLNLASRTFSGRRRLFERPTWEKAKVLAAEKAEEYGKNPLFITTKDINRAYQGMYSSIERAGKNSPIQGGNADVAKVAVSIMWHRLETEFGAYLVSFVHDEFVVEAKPENAKEVSQLISDSIKKGGEYFMHTVVMECEGRTADSWGKKK